MTPPSMPLLASVGGVPPPGQDLSKPLAEESGEQTIAVVQMASRNSLALFKGETSLQRYFDEHPDVVGAHDMVTVRENNIRLLRFAFAVAAVSVGVQFYMGQPLLALICIAPLLFLMPLIVNNPQPLEREATRFHVIEELIAMKSLPDAAELLRDLSVDQLFQEACGVARVVSVAGRKYPVAGSRIDSIQAQRQLHILVAEWGNWRAVFALNQLAEKGFLADIEPGYSLSAVAESPRLIEYALSGDEQAQAAAEILAGKSAAFETAYRQAQREKEGGEVFR